MQIRHFRRFRQNGSFWAGDKSTVCATPKQGAAMLVWACSGLINSPPTMGPQSPFFLSLLREVGLRQHVAMFERFLAKPKFLGLFAVM